MKARIKENGNIVTLTEYNLYSGHVRVEVSDKGGEGVLLGIDEVEIMPDDGLQQRIENMEKKVDDIWKFVEGYKEREVERLKARIEEIKQESRFRNYGH